MQDLIPPHTYAPAKYPAADLKLIDTPRLVYLIIRKNNDLMNFCSTIDDVADFMVDVSS